MLSCSWFTQYLARCLVHSRCSVNVCCYFEVFFYYQATNDHAFSIVFPNNLIPPPLVLTSTCELENTNSYIFQVILPHFPKIIVLGLSLCTLIFSHLRSSSLFHQISCDGDREQERVFVSEEFKDHSFEGLTFCFTVQVFFLPGGSC